MPGLVSQRAMQGNDVAAGEQIIQGDIFNTAVLRGETVIGNDTHSESTADIDKDPSDFASPDHAYGLPVKIKTCQSAQGEIELPCAVVSLVDTANGGQQQRNGVLRHGIGRISGDMDDVNLSKGRLHVHIVIAR